MFEYKASSLLLNSACLVVSGKVMWNECLTADFILVHYAGFSVTGILASEMSSQRTCGNEDSAACDSECKTEIITIDLANAHLPSFRRVWAHEAPVSLYTKCLLALQGRKSISAQTATSAEKLHYTVGIKGFWGHLLWYIFKRIDVIDRLSSRNAVSVTFTLHCWKTERYWENGNAFVFMPRWFVRL